MSETVRIGSGIKEFCYPKIFRSIIRTYPDIRYTYIIIVYIMVYIFFQNKNNLDHYL